jgi:hypothetical protein
MSFPSRDAGTFQRQLKVQRLSIPFTIVGNATAASVAITCDEPSLMFIKTSGVDQITAAVPAGDTATYTVAPSDAAGTFDVFINVSEAVSKVVNAQLINRDTGTIEVMKLGSATGLSTLGSIMLAGVSASHNLSTAVTLNACLVVEYIK